MDLALPGWRAELALGDLFGRVVRMLEILERVDELLGEVVSLPLLVVVALSLLDFGDFVSGATERDDGPIALIVVV